MYFSFAALNVTQLGAELMSENTCVVTLEGCFPPCCGSRGITKRLWFGTEFRYRPAQQHISCYKISISMSYGDSTKIYYGQLPSVLVVEAESTEHINLPLETEHIDTLQNCFNKCIKTIDVGHELTKIAYTRGCFTVDITLSLPEGLTIRSLLEAEFTYCKLIDEPNAFTIQIACISFNPLDTFIHEKIIVEIPNTEGCINDYIIIIGLPIIVPCMDQKCWKAAKFNIELCMKMCLQNVAEDVDAIQLCESVAIYALQSPSSQNVTVVLDILGALANSLGSRRLEAVNNIMLSLLLELEKQKNMHLFSEPTGRRLLTVLDLVLNDDNSYSFMKVDLGPILLENLERVMKFVARGISGGILLSKFEYTGNNAIVLATAEKIENEGDYIFPNPDSNITDVKMKIPKEILCDQQNIQDCRPTVASVITKHLPQYLHKANSCNESVVHSLLLSTQLSGAMNYRINILHSPVTLYFRLTPPVCSRYIVMSRPLGMFPQCF
jgi:hypothetical protein